MKTRRAKSQEPTLRDRLSTDFIQALASDFAVHGIDVIKTLRERSPEKYAQIAAALIMAVEQPPSGQDYSRCDSQADIGRQLLRQIGLPDVKMTDAMIEQAAEANAALVDRLESIAMGN